MSTENEKRPDLDESAAEIIKNIKRSGAFDKIKKDVLDGLQEMNEIKVSHDYMVNLVRINFDKQSKECKHLLTINERRAMLKGMLGSATMFDSLPNSIKQSQLYKDAAEKLAGEVDKLIPQYYPDLIFNLTTRQWEAPRANSSIVPNTETSTTTDIPPTASYSSSFGAPPPPQDEPIQDMELDSSSTTPSVSSTEDSKHFTNYSDLNNIALPPPPPAPSF